MARGLAEDRSRRLGRAEMLFTELEQLPEGYQPTQQEVDLFEKLALKIIRTYAPDESYRFEPPPEIAAMVDIVQALGLQAGARVSEMIGEIVRLKSLEAAPAPEAPAEAPAPEKKGK